MSASNQRLQPSVCKGMDISALSSLTGFQDLDHSFSKVSASNQILQPSASKGMDISALSSLRFLQSIDLQGTKVSESDKQHLRDKGIDVSG